MRFVVVQDHKENLRKCTAVPLARLEGFQLVRLRAPVSGEPAREVDGDIWLTVDGPPLTRADCSRDRDGAAVVVFDATWARVDRLERRVRPPPGALVRRRSLPSGFRTAYPRASRWYKDPSEGLATVEAIFVAAIVLGEPRPEVLSGYRWADEFLRRNEGVIGRFLAGSGR